MSLPQISIHQLLEAGIHFGHHKRRWNPKMKPYIYGIHNGIHIIDLEKTVSLFENALKVAHEVAANKGRILFVGTKRQAQEYVAQAATRCGQYYVNHRWLGGMLTNWKTVSLSLQRLRNLENRLNENNLGLTKKEILSLVHERDKLEYVLGGIKEIGGIPDILFVIDTNKEEIAVKEANKLNIPIIAVVDSNSIPDNITYPIPGNDDSTRAIATYCELISSAILDGLQADMIASGIEIRDTENSADQAITERDQTASHREQETLEPDQTASHREQETLEPDQTASHREQETLEPDQTASHREQETPEPDQTASHREQETPEPDQTASEQEQEATDPEQLVSAVEKTSVSSRQTSPSSKTPLKTYPKTPTPKKSLSASLKTSEKSVKPRKKPRETLKFPQTQIKKKTSYSKEQK